MHLSSRSSLGLATFPARFCLLLSVLVAAERVSLAQESGAVDLYARGDYAAVVRRLDPAYKAGTAKIQDRLILARARIHLNQSDQALAVLRSVLAMDRENPEANGLTGRLLYDAGKAQESLEYLEHAYRLKQDAETASILGHCYHALKDDRKAKGYLEKALEQDIRDPDNSFLLGRICLERGLGALAEKYLLAAQEAGMDSAELHLALARTYVLEHKLVGPVLVVRVPRAVQPGDVVDGQVVLSRLEDVPDQFKVCTAYSAMYEGYRLLATDPQSAEGLFCVASAWLEAGDTDRSQALLAKLKAVEPDSSRVLDLAARLAVQTMDVASLKQSLTTARAGKRMDDSQIVQAYYMAALRLRAAGNRPEATAMLQEAERIQPASGKVLRSLALLSLAQGQTDKARGYYVRLVELFPDAPDIDELRNRVKVLQEKTGVNP